LGRQRRDAERHHVATMETYVSFMRKEYAHKQ
jgi:hypothetical protein